MVRKLTGDIRLETALNLRPWGLFKLKSPNPFPKDKGLYHQAWKSALSTVGLDSLEPIEVGSSYVPVSQFTEYILKQIKQATRNVRIEDQIEYMEWASGELLLHNSDILIEPQCCSDIGNLSEWERVADYREAEWSMVYIGHPWIYMKYDDGWLYFTDYTEGNAESAKVMYAIEPEKIAQAVKLIKPETEAFLERYIRILGKID